MKKILIVDTSYPINNRTNKFRSSLLSEFDVHVLSWDRSGAKGPYPDGFFLFKMRSELGNRFKKLFLFPLFIMFGLKTCRRLKPNILFASHWDSLFLGCLVKVFYPRVKLIYDCLDVPTSKFEIVVKILTKLESYCIQFVDLTIFASRYFPELYKKDVYNIVFENYPSRSLLDVTDKVPSWYYEAIELKNTRLPIVAWVGVVRYPSVLENLIESIVDLEMILFIFGDGPSLRFAKNMVDRKALNEKIYFWGRYGQNELPYIYQLSDFIWAAYPTDNLNAIYAISNKFFECSMFKRVPVISSSTRMAEDLKVNYSSNVILVDEFDVEDIKYKLALAATGSFQFRPYQKEEFWEDHVGVFLDILRRL